MIRRRLLMQMISNAIVHRTLENTYIRNNGIVGGASGNLLHEFSVVSGETYTVHFDKTQLKRIGQSAVPPKGNKNAVGVQPKALMIASIVYYFKKAMTSLMDCVKVKVVKDK